MRRVRVVSIRSKLFGPAPILPGEDQAAYEQLLTEALNAADPKDVIDEILVRDFVNETWANVRRIFCAKEGVLGAKLVSYLESILQKSARLPAGEREALLRDWRAHEPAALEKMVHILSAANLSYETLVALSFRSGLEELERLDRLCSIGQARRTALLRILENRRAAIADTSRKHVGSPNNDRIESRHYGGAASGQESR